MMTESQRQDLFSFHQNYPKLLAPWWAKTGHLQTLLGFVFNHPKVKKYDEIFLIPTTEGDHLWAGLMQGHRPLMLTVYHGLGGDVDSYFVQQALRVARSLDVSALALNQRGAGEGIHHARGMYHSCRWEDLEAVTTFVKEKYPRHFHLHLAISMTGNMTLKWLSKNESRNFPDLCAVFNSPLILESSALRLQGGLTRLYDLHFVQSFKKMLKQRKEKKLVSAIPTFSQFSTVRDLDELWTAPQSGYRSREAYYEAGSSFHDLEKIKNPVLVLTAADDPIVDAKDYERAKWSSWASVRIETHGGHGGFLQKDKNFFGDHFWLDEYLRHLMEKILQQLEA